MFENLTLPRLVGLSMNMILPFMDIWVSPGPTERADRSRCCLTLYWAGGTIEVLSSIHFIESEMGIQIET